MKILLLLTAYSVSALSQSLSPEEQKQLVEENRSLREEVTRLRSQQQNTVDSKKLIEVLKKGQKFQEEQLKALEELDKEI